MLQVYIDDSGKSDQSPSLILAGYLASDYAWDSFSVKWRSILKAHSLKEFHTYNVWKMRNVPGNAVRQSVLLVQAMECIKKYVDHAFVVSVPFGAHAHWFSQKDNKDLAALRTYNFAFWDIISKIHLHAWKYEADEKVRVVFDRQGGESERKILSGFEAAKAICATHFPGMEISEPVFHHGDDCPPLQAADFLAWLVRRDAYHGFNKIDREKSEEAVFL